MSELFSWTRPKNIDFPIVWQTFEAKNSNNAIVTYRVQDLPETHFEDAIQFMTEHFLPDEPITKAIGGAHEEAYVKDFQMLWRTIIAQKMSLVCFAENSDKIVGLSILYVSSKDDKFFSEMSKTINNPTTLKVLGAYKCLYDKNNFNVFEYHNTDKYLATLGLAISRDKRGQKISGKLLEARKHLGRVFNLKFTHNRFSNDKLFETAKGIGFKEILRISYEELKQYNEIFDFPNIESEYMIAGSWVF